MPATPLAEAFVRVRADTSSFKDDVRKGFDDADSHGRGSKAGRDAGAGFTVGFSASLSGLGDVTGKIFDLLASVGKWTALASAVAALGAAAASAAGYTLALAAAIAPVGGLTAALPGLLLTGVAALVAWKLATYGVGEAMGAVWSGDAKALEAALAKLTPAAHDFVTEFEAAKPAFKSFQEAAQEGFFSQLSGSLAGIATALGGLKQPLRDLSSEFGGLVREALNFLSAQRTVDQFSRILGNTGTLVGALWSALQPLLKGFVDLGVVGSDWLASMSGGLTSSLTKFGEWMSRVSESGQAFAWMNNALAVVKQLGSLIKDVWDILGGLLKAAKEAGGSALGVLGQLVDAFAKWVNSTKGQEVLVTLFKALNEVGRALLPIITALGTAVAAIAPVAAQLATALGPILAQAIAALGPAIAAIGPGVIALIHGLGAAVATIAPILVPLGQAIGTAFSLLSPLLAAVGQAIAALLPGVRDFLTAFATGLAQLAPAMAPIGAALGGILTSLSPLLAMIGQVAVVIAQSLAAGIQSVLPSLQLLVSSLGQALLALVPIVPMIIQLAASFINALVPALAPLLPQVADLITQLVSGLVPALAPLLPIIGQIAGLIGQTFVSVIGALIEVILQILPPLSQTAQILGQALLQALQMILPQLPPLVSAFLSLLPGIVNLLPPLAQLAVSLLPRTFEAIGQILPLLPDLIRNAILLAQAWYPLIPIFADLLTKLAPHIPLFIEIAAVIAKELIPPIVRLAEVVVGMVNTVNRTFQLMYDTLVGHSIIPDLINGINSWFGRLPGMLLGWVGQAKDAAIGQFQSLIGWVSGLPGALVSALGNMGNLFSGAGHDLIIGFWNGMVGMWDWLRTSIYNFFSGIMPQWVKDALGIHSPSKLFAAIGKQLPAGLVVGMDAGQPMLQAAAERMAGATDAFTAPSSAPAFTGSFGTAATSSPAAAAVGGVTIENIHVQGVLDPNDPSSYRRMVEGIRGAIRDLEREVYA